MSTTKVVRLTVPQIDMLINAGAYYETMLEDEEKPGSVALLGRALEALAEARAS